MEASPGVHHLVGMAEVAELLGVSRQRAWVLSRRPGFPEPVVRLVGGAVWERAAVLRWMEHRAEVDESP